MRSPKKGQAQSAGSTGEQTAAQMGRHYRTDMLALTDAFFDNFERRPHDGEGWGLGLDDKRPFGNSSVTDDILEIIGYDAKKCPHCNEVIPSDDGRDPSLYAEHLYNELAEFIKEEWRSKQ